MESGIIKFHDGAEHFDGGYQSYDGSNIWETDRETMHLNLTHTLEGILPSSPTQTLVMDYENSFCEQHNEIKLEYESEDEIQTRKISISSIESDDFIYGISPAVEIIAIDPDCEYSSPLRCHDEEEDSCSSNSNFNEKIRTNSNCSNMSIESSDTEEQSNNINSYMTQNDSDKNFGNDSVRYKEENKQFDTGDNKQLIKYSANKKSVSLPLSPNDKHNQSITDLNSMTFEDLDFDELNSIAKHIYLSPTKSNCEYTVITPGKNLNRSNYANIEIESKNENFLDDYKLDADIDVKNFDLTTYITEDDCKLPPPTPGRNIHLDKFEISPKKKSINLNHKTKKRSVKEMSRCYKSTSIENVKRGYKNLRQDAESDSDENIDVETVSESSYVWKPQTKEANKIEVAKPILIEEDDNRDPTWSPLNKTLKPQRSNIRSKIRASLPNQISTNSHIRTRILNAGAQLSRNKLITAVSKVPENVIQKDHDYCSPTKKCLNTKPNPPRRAIEIPTAYNILDRRQQRLGLGRGKNISMCSKPPDDTDTDNDIKPDVNLKFKKIEDNIDTLKNSNEITNIKVEEMSTVEEKPLIINIKLEEIPIKKKKLNLQEYKKRRENNIETKDRKLDIIKTNNIDTTQTIKTTATSEQNHISYNMLQIKEEKKSNETNINQLKNDNKNEENGFDPIREATKKALRMQFLKKSYKNKNDEPNFKIITPEALLPLAELTKNSLESHKNKTDLLVGNNAYPDYEEIIIVSMCCNTAITIPPDNINIVNKTSQIDDILSRSSLLSNINDTIKKANSCGGNINISSNSLLSSITNVVLKKTTNFVSGLPTINVSPNIALSPPNSLSPGKPEKSKTNNENIKLLSNKQNENECLEHGEDKIIMHLRKDRIRPTCYSISTQTDLLVQFPVLNRLERNKNSDRKKRNQRKSSCSSYESENLKRISKYDSTYRRSRKSPSPNRKRRQQHSLLHNNNNNNHNNNYHHHNNRNSLSPKLGSRSPLNKFTLQNGYSQRLNLNNRSKSKDQKHYRPQSRGSSISHSSTSSDISRTKNGYWNQRRYSTSSHSSSASSRSRSRGSSKSRHHMGSNIVEREQRHASPEERRIVYVGRIERDISKEDLKSKFVSYGPIKQITIHHKDTGLKYGFVTYERAQDAFTAIEVSGRDPKISMYDISFGGRRAFCRNLYSDLDGTGMNFQMAKTTSLQSTKSNVCDDSFEALLQKVKDKIGVKKPLLKT